MTPLRPITEEDLHAYVDGVLDPTRRGEVQAYLDTHADVARRVAGYVRQRQALRAALAPVAEEPVPPQLSLRHLTERQRPPRALPWRMAAAAVVLLALGGAGGWSLHGTVPQAQPTGVAALAQEAAYTYDVYGPDQTHAVEYKAADRAQLVDWISNRLQRTIAVPDLSAAGYRFMGGRLVATPHGPAGLLMFENKDGLRLAMMVRPMTTIDHTAHMTEHSSGAVAGYAWADQGIGYSLVGTTSTAVLHPLANEIRRQVEEKV